MIVVVAFESPSIVPGRDDVTVIGQPIEQRGGRLGVAKSASFWIRRTASIQRRTAYLVTINKYSQTQTQDPESSLDHNVYSAEEVMTCVTALKLQTSDVALAPGRVHQEPESSSVRRS